MKRVALLITLMIMVCGVQAKSYDKLRAVLFDKAITYDTCRVFNQITNDELRVYVNQTTEYGNWKRAKSGNPLWDLNSNVLQFEPYRTEQQQIVIPKVIYDEYMLGTRLYKAGVATISIAAPITLIGTICYFNHDINTHLAGTILLGVGSTILGCSIPLLCSGDHLKRTANKDYILQNYF